MCLSLLPLVGRLLLLFLWEAKGYQKPGVLPTADVPEFRVKRLTWARHIVKQGRIWKRQLESREGRADGEFWQASAFRDDTPKTFVLKNV